MTSHKIGAIKSNTKHSRQKTGKTTTGTVHGELSQPTYFAH